MNDSFFKTELLNLLRDVREHLTFANELGVIGFETAFFAEADLSEKSEKQEKVTTPKKFAPFAPTPKPTLSESDIVSSNEERIKLTASAAKSTSTSTPPRFSSLREKLEATKLSKISPASVSALNSELTDDLEKQPLETVVADSAQDLSKTPKNTGENKMEGTSLFGDLTPEKETLPASNETFEEIRADIGECVRCPLYQGRTKIVHTDGNRESRVLFVGEAPGADEDASGKPFVGRAGQLLTKIIEAIGLKREEVLIGNVNRCRPPQNRTPTIQEARTCRQFLMREIAVARPEIIVVMGNTATQNLLDTKEGITKLRGKFQDYYGIKVMPTFHPAYLLRDPSKKRETWEDMKIVRDELAKTAK